MSKKVCPMTGRAGLSCQRCGEWFFVLAEDGAVTYAVHAGACPICAGKLAYRGNVQQDGTVTQTGQWSACDDQCTSARGVVCDCKCGGRNHGTGRMVTVTWVEGRATLDLNGALAASLAAKRLPEIEECERLAAELVGRLEEVYSDVLADSRNGVWMSRDRWERAEEWRHLRGEVNRATSHRSPKSLKTPAGRLKVLRAVAERIGYSPSTPEASGQISLI